MDEFILGLYQRLFLISAVMLICVRRARDLMGDVNNNVNENRRNLIVAGLLVLMSMALCIDGMVTCDLILYKILTQ